MRTTFDSWQAIQRAMQGVRKQTVLTPASKNTITIKRAEIENLASMNVTGNLDSLTAISYSAKISELIPVKNQLSSSNLNATSYLSTQMGLINTSNTTAYKYHERINDLLFYINNDNLNTTLSTSRNLQAALCSDAHGLYVNAARSLLAEVDLQDYHEAYDGCLEQGVNARSKKEELMENETEIEIFPNPTNNVVTINSSIPMDMVSLYDISGNLVLQFSAKGRLSISIENIPTSGMYIAEIRMLDDQEIIYKKLIKN